MPLKRSQDATDAATRRFLLRRSVENDDEPSSAAAGAQGVGAGDPSTMHVAYAWDLAGALAEDPAIIELRAAALAGGRLDEATETMPEVFNEHSAPKRGNAWPRIAAGLIATAAAAASIVMMTPGLRGWLPAAVTGGGPTAIPAGTVYGDASGAQQQINLADGSVIRLDARSRVRVNFTGQSREVTMLEGRAYFTVQHGPRPFVVRSPGGETIDLGTRFVIELGGGLTRVSLVEGKIAIRPAGSARELPLEPGEVSGYTDKGAILAKAPARNDPIDWTSGRLKFEDTPLVEAVARLSRYSDKPILLAPDVAASNRRVTGVFFIGDSENFAATLASALDLKVVSDEDGRRHLIQP